MFLYRVFYFITFSFLFFCLYFFFIFYLFCLFFLLFCFFCLEISNIVQFFWKKILVLKFCAQFQKMIVFENNLVVFPKISYFQNLCTISKNILFLISKKKSGGIKKNGSGLKIFTQFKKMVIFKKILNNFKKYSCFPIFHKLKTVCD